MRVFSSILFALMAFILPMAGVEHYFCTMNMTFIDKADDCPSDEKDCCKKELNHKSEAPDCMIVMKLIPNADIRQPAHLPTMEMDCLFLEAPAIGDFVETHIVAILPCSHRGPPDLRRLYVMQRRLLI